MANVGFRSASTPKVIPNKAPWANVSPKKAIFRHTTKLPNGPAEIANNMPANNGISHHTANNSVMLMISVSVISAAMLVVMVVRVMSDGAVEFASKEF